MKVLYLTQILKKMKMMKLDMKHRQLEMNQKRLIREKQMRMHWMRLQKIELKEGMV